MDNKKLHNEDEIDLIGIFETLWNGKWIIIGITFVSFLVSLNFNNNQSSSYKVSTPIKYGKSSTFIDFISINDILKENQLYATSINPNGYKIDAPLIFQMFISEFNDYEEMISSLKKNELIMQSIKDLDEDNKRKALIGYAKSFEISEISLGKGIDDIEIKKIMLSFKWHDVEEGKTLFNEALVLTLQNVKAMIINDLGKLATSIDIKKQRELEMLHVKLSLIERNEIAKTKRRIIYLKEQSAIAKELGLEANNLDVNAMIISQMNDRSLIINSKNEAEITGHTKTYNDFPFYLRGFKAIDKEISLIKSRSKEKQLLLSDDYVLVKEKIQVLESDLSSAQLRNSLMTLENANPNTWVEFNFSFAESKSLIKSSRQYIVVFIVIGVTIGVIYVLIANSIRRRKKRLADV